MAGIPRVCAINKSSTSKLKPSRRCKLENAAGGVAAEDLEAALGIGKRQTGDQAHDTVEDDTGHFTPLALVHSDERAVERAGADGDGRSLLLGGGEQFGKFVDGSGKIGVGRQNPIAFGFEHSMADSITLSTVAGIADQAQARLTSGAVFNDRRRGVGGAVIHDQQLGILVGSGVQPRQNYIQGGGKAALFVVRGNDDRERQRSIIATGTIGLRSRYSGSRMKSPERGCGEAASLIKMDRLPFRATPLASPYEGFDTLPVAILLDNVRSMYNVGVIFSYSRRRGGGKTSADRDHGLSAEIGDPQNRSGGRRDGALGTRARPDAGARWTARAGL